MNRSNLFSTLRAVVFINVLFSALSSQAAIDKNFDPRFTTNTNGDIYIVGNTNMTRSTTSNPGAEQCAAARAGGNRANNQRFMQQVDPSRDNFTDFSDDLSILDYENRGWFLNLVGK